MSPDVRPPRDAAPPRRPGAPAPAATSPTPTGAPAATPALAPFRIMDCTITSIALGRGAQNLRELRDRMTEVPLQSISHHFYEALLRPVFDDPEYRNDFAVWARRQLRDNLLAERLGAIDPMEFQSLETLRQHVLDVIEDRLSEVAFVPWAAAGHEFHFLRSQMVILDTGLRAATPADLAVLVPRLPVGSIFYHFVEGRRRPPVMVDDFSVWLADWGPDYEPVRDAIAAIDYHLWSLTEMRAQIGRCLRAVPRLEDRSATGAEPPAAGAPGAERPATGTPRADRAAAGGAGGSRPAAGAPGGGGR